ncbi:helix-turn-helix domain-containing protein [Methylobacterium sp. J-090]|uniref:helix-turn-helix domain-containing protein n=1 Tax=Methylobacterium sp. J-090 TaxID=2836666 RepID=UPI001FB993CB|nr:helix-turn-helix domain-containing protein [Methylobacterium sp. J-090]MCJ2080158.1 helix-turn-helix domain-containing protein [Methylobacterium sp. J-090]
MSDQTITAIQRISPADAAKRLGVSTSYLSNMRCSEDGDGPVFYQIGRKIEYRIADLDAWLAGRRRTTTARKMGPRKRRAANDAGSRHAAV